MEVFIQNKAVETIERSRVIDSIEILIGERNATQAAYSNMPEQDVVVENLDSFLKLIKDKFPLEYQIAVENYELELEKIMASW